MLLNWLYQTTLDLSLLTGLVLLLRPLVRRTLGATPAYWLWLIPLFRIFLPAPIPRPASPIESPRLISESTALMSGHPMNTEVFLIANNLPWLEIWLAGVIACIVLQIYLQWRFEKEILSGSSKTRLQEKKAMHFFTEFGLQPDQLRTSQRIASPCVSGIVTPRIFLPVDFEQQFNSEEQYWAIRHELTHIARRDLWAQFLGEMFRACFWFNPVVHFALRCLREDQEYACDQTLLAGCDSRQRYDYGKSLLNGSAIQLAPSMLTFFTNKKERFIMLGKHSNSRFNTYCGALLCTAISVFALTSAPVSIAQSDARPIFDDVYDAEQPKRFTGRIMRVDYGEHFMLLHVNAENEDGTVTQWVVEGGSYEDMHAAGLDSNALYPGRSVEIRGYQSKDLSCDPKCKLNGRDISFTDD